MIEEPFAPTETTADVETPRPESVARSRRAVIAGALGGVAGLITARFGLPDTARAAAGAPLIVGSEANNAGTSNTQLIANSDVVTFKLYQTGPGTALMGYTTPTTGTTRGVYGRVDSPNGDGVQGRNAGTAGTGAAIRAYGGNNDGVVATTDSNSKVAIRATGANGTAIYASATQIGIHGSGYQGVVGTAASSFASAGVQGDGGTGTDNIGVYGSVNNATGRGVYGLNQADSNTSYGVYGKTNSTTGSTDQGAAGVRGVDNGGAGGTNGVWGSTSSTEGNGVHGTATANSADAWAVFGIGTGDANGVVGQSATGLALYGLGDGAVTGSFAKASGTFKIDHPLDPANRYLNHSFVESPDMMNIYNGNAHLGPAGEATIELPGWFGALNRDFRYQLTAIGSAAPGLFVKSGVSHNRFVIAGGSAGQEVSWQVTGIRQDAWANAHRVEVEVDKVGREKGRYLHPTEHGKAASMGVTFKIKG